jgi:hypothetical protein
MAEFILRSSFFQAALVCHSASFARARAICCGVKLRTEKKVVWALSEWNNADPGPTSSIQVPAEAGAAGNSDLQR